MIKLFTYSLGAWKTILFEGATDAVKREVISTSMRDLMFTDQNVLAARTILGVHHKPRPISMQTTSSPLNMLRCASCHRTNSTLERRTGATTHASESVLLRTEAGFPPVKPTRDLLVRPWRTRPDVKRVGRIMRPRDSRTRATHAREATRIQWPPRYHDVKHVDMKNAEVGDLIWKLQR